MTTRQALSVAPAAAAAMTGRHQRGTGLGHGYVALDDGAVLAITAPGRPRMPNGIEVELVIPAGADVLVGDGLVVCGRQAVTVGPLWNPVARVVVKLRVRPSVVIDVDTLAGWGPGLTPLGDDLLAGYIAGVHLRDGDDPRPAAIAAQAGARTNALSATLLRLAAMGAVPEPAHALLGAADLEPLLAFGATSGVALAVGLAAGLDDGSREGGAATTAAWTVGLQLPSGLSHLCIHGTSAQPAGVLPTL